MSSLAIAYCGQKLFGSRFSIFKPLRRHRVDRLKLHAITVEDRQMLAAGGNDDLAVAENSCMGEAIERYVLHNPNSEKLVFASYKQLESVALDPRRCLFYPEQVYHNPNLGISRFDAKQIVSWIEGRNLATNQATYIATDFINTSSLNPKSCWDKPLSTGTACHHNKCTATLYALFEVIERDVFMQYWQNKYGASVEQTCQTKFGLVIVLRLMSDMPLDIALVIIKNSVHNRPAIAVGCAARLSWKEAKKSALAEARLTYLWLLERATTAISLDMIVEQLRSVPKPIIHAEFYRFSENARYLNFYTENKIHTFATSQALPNLSEMSVEQQLEQLTEYLAYLGYEVITVNLTPSWLESFGLVVIKVLVPGLVPLSRGLLLCHSNNPRLNIQGEVDAPHPLP